MNDLQADWNSVMQRFWQSRGFSSKVSSITPRVDNLQLFHKKELQPSVLLRLAVIPGSVGVDGLAAPNESAVVAGTLKLEKGSVLS